MLWNQSLQPTAGGAALLTKTTTPGVYAIGDVTAKLMLAHVAEAQGIIAAETVAGVPTIGISRYVMMPRVTFCQPQVASFGLTEAEARADAAARGSDIAVAKFPFRANGKAHGYGDPTGFAKVIADCAHGELLGAHLVGADVAELLTELILAQRWDLTVEELVRNVHAHPTLSEGASVLPIDSRYDKANSWHTDVTFVDRIPKASLLRAVSLPAYGGMPSAPAE